jgi:flagellar FliJ protein
MKRFKFGLEKILQLRQHHEQEAKNELGRATGILTGIENQIKQNAQKHSMAVLERFTGIDTVNGNDEERGAASMITWNSYILRLEQEAEKLMKDAARAELVVEEKRNLYLEASRDLKMFEKLREKQEKEYRKKMLVTETNERDDIWRPTKL